MENYVWLLFFALGVLVVNQLASIARSLQAMAAMMKRLLSDQGVEWEAAGPPSATVEELASNPKTYILAIKAYREQTGLGLKDAKAVVDDLRARRKSVPDPSLQPTTGQPPN